MMGTAREIVLHGGPLSRRSVRASTADTVWSGSHGDATVLYAIDWESCRGMYIGEDDSPGSELDRLRAVNAELVAALRRCLCIVRLKCGNLHDYTNAIQDRANAALAAAERETP